MTRKVYSKIQWYISAPYNISFYRLYDSNSSESMIQATEKAERVSKLLFSPSSPNVTLGLCPIARLPGVVSEPIYTYISAWTSSPLKTTSYNTLVDDVDPVRAYSLRAGAVCAIDS